MYTANNLSLIFSMSLRETIKLMEKVDGEEM